MFGAIVAGRLVQTNLQQMYVVVYTLNLTVPLTLRADVDRSDESHFLFPLEQPYDVNHLTVFLLGTVPFPDGYGASVHLAWPGNDYQPLGVLTNTKPSAIYRLRPLLPPDAQSSIPSPPANLGIEIAPLSQLEVLASSLGDGQGKGKGKEVAQNVDVGKVAEKVVKNLFNYLHSFGGDVKLTPDTPIPLSVFQQWYTNFTRKIEADRGAAFLDRED